VVEGALDMVVPAAALSPGEAAIRTSIANPGLIQAQSRMLPNHQSTPEAVKLAETNICSDVVSTLASVGQTTCSKTPTYCIQLNEL
jgi:hypothetical protein